MNNFTNEQILEIVKRYYQRDGCVLEGEEQWCDKYVDYVSEEKDVKGNLISELTIYKVKGEKNKHVAVKTVRTNAGYWGVSDQVATDAYFVVPKEVTKIVYIKESND